MYGQDSQTASPDTFYGPPCCTNWCLLCRKSSLKNQQLSLEFSRAIIWGDSWGKNAATDLGFCSPIYIVAVTKPVASKGFQNTNRDDKMEWTKYLTEGCMTLSEHGILNKFHRLPVPCSWCSFLDLLLVQFGFKYEWLITETHSLFFGFVLQRQIKLR